MNYIILDLEWNQPCSFESESFRKNGEKLLFEIIQIGAVKIQNGAIADEISMLVKPVVYTSMHPMVKRMTKITSGMLKDASGFAETFRQFMMWCGNDFAFITWGNDDVSVLRQNMTFHQIHTPLPPFYDLQKLYCAKKGDSTAKGLKKAVEEMEIPTDNFHQFHNAHDDAYYTAEIFLHMPDTSLLTDYPETPRPLRHIPPEEKQKAALARKRTKQFTDFPKPLEEGEGEEYLPTRAQYKNVTDVLSDKTFGARPCPVCGRRMKPDYSANADCGGGNYCSILKCPNHGNYLLRFHVSAENGAVRVKFKVTKATDPDLRRVHLTKIANRK